MSKATVIDITDEPISGERLAEICDRNARLMGLPGLAEVDDDLCKSVLDVQTLIIELRRMYMLERRLRVLIVNQINAGPPN